MLELFLLLDIPARVLYNKYRIYTITPTQGAFHAKLRGRLLQNGECPVQDFLDSLDSKMRAKLLVGFALLEANGPQLREPYSKHIGDGIFEIRAKQGSNITRVLYFFFVGRQIVLTNGFTKKTQKTPPAELATSKSTAPHISNERLTIKSQP